MKSGDFVEPIEDIIGYKKNVYATVNDLLKIKSVDFSPVLIVFKYNKPGDNFPVHKTKIAQVNNPEERIQKIKEKEDAERRVIIKPIVKPKKRKK